MERLKQLLKMNHRQILIEKDINMLGYNFINRKSPICIVIDVDTIGSSHCVNFEEKPNEIISDNKTHLGSVSRTGIYIVEQIMNDIDVSVLIVDGSQNGFYGSRLFYAENKETNVFNHIKLFVELKGTGVAKYYSKCINSEIVKECLIKSNYKEEDELDVIFNSKILTERTGIEHICLSSGIKNVNQMNETIDFKDVGTNIMMIYNFLSLMIPNCSQIYTIPDNKVKPIYIKQKDNTPALELPNIEPATPENYIMKHISKEKEENVANFLDNIGNEDMDSIQE